MTKTNHRTWGTLAGSIPVVIELAALVAVSAVFFVLGFRFEPAAAGPAGMPDPPAFNLAFAGSPPALVPGSLAIDSYLRQLPGGRTRLTLEAYGRFTLDVLLKIPGVKDVRSSLALEVVKNSTALPLFDRSRL